METMDCLVTVEMTFFKDDVEMIFLLEGPVLTPTSLTVVMEWMK